MVSEYSKKFHHPYDDLLVIKLIVANCEIKSASVDTCNSIEILFYYYFIMLALYEKELVLASYLITWFMRHTFYTKGAFKLPMKIGVKTATREFMVDFMVMDTTSVYKIIIRRPLFNCLKATLSIFNLTCNLSMT